MTDANVIVFAVLVSVIAVFWLYTHGLLVKIDLLRSTVRALKQANEEKDEAMSQIKAGIVVEVLLREASVKGQDWNVSADAKTWTQRKEGRA